ncbi:MAG TPA: chemotaxis protein CheW [Candidatus Acidoferrales bacterium]|jgi:chemotaxis signal transduction protein|nr:chemotaxis protein CheW [Candidatus Acidoferrales bacterium]
MSAAVENADNKSYVLVQIGDRRFAMSAATVSELAPPVRLHQFPQSSPLVAGVIVRRGRIVPVYDVSRILAGKNSSAHRFYLVASRDFGSVREPSAIPVDGECELVTAPMQTPDPASPKYISGKLTIGEETIEVLDLNALVTSATAQPNESDYAESEA